MTEEQIKKIEERLDKLESKPKDRWDKAHIIGAIIGAVLVPLAIGFAGMAYARAQKEAEIQVQERRFDREFEIAQANAQTNARVGQGGLIVSMLDALVSADVKRKKLATQILLIVMPETGPGLVRTVSETETDVTLREFAGDALARRRSALITELFDERAARRGDAYVSLIAGWAKDPSIVPELIKYARENTSNENGIYNTLVLLSHMDREALKPDVAAIKKFSQDMEGIGPKIRERAEVLRSRLPTSG